MAEHNVNHMILITESRSYQRDPESIISGAVQNIVFTLHVHVLNT